MLARIFAYTVVLFLFLGSGCFTPVLEYDKDLRYEEYLIEHEISEVQARNSALTTDINSIVTPAGCHTCTQKEIRYCLGKGLIYDHCCCDKRYREVLPFIPHSCYVGADLCVPIVSDCAEYSRLRTCCCDKYVLEKWKKKFMESGTKSTSGQSFTLILLIEIVYIFVQYFIIK